MSIMEDQAKLFRKESLPNKLENTSVAARSERIGSIKPWAASIALMLCVFFILLQPYTRRVDVNFITIALSGKQRVEATSEGVISEIFVEQGDFVHRGQKLIAYTREQFGRSGSTNLQKRNLLSQNLIQLNELSVKNSQNYQISIEKLGLQSKFSELRAAELEARVHGLVSARKILESKIVVGNHLLAEGAVAESYIQDLKDKVLNIDNLSYYAKQNLIKEQQFLSEAPNLAKQYKNELEIQINHNRSEAIEIERELIDIESQILSYIVADFDGVVAAVSASKGSSIRKSDSLIVVEAEKGEPTARILIPKQAAALANLGQKVTLRYDAYPFTKFGTAQAEIIQIDNTVTSTKDVLRTLGLQAEEPGYLATIKIIESSNSNLEIDYQKDGLTGRASVMLEEHSLIRWIFDPLINSVVQAGQGKLNEY
ncbi:HlyD family efflux transporter periplasmic adaptor subunit [Pseudomonas sp. Ag1]|jgi:membrane fusion protein|uniref:HlyD family efflux transporter periplasmic adaptor subunit n=1 Tax=Pseudomonas sp. Ag1 TaxID=1197727 RepID=UPI0002D98A9B|nr:HlyD family efflux transporter periplasmic adaptor subunit [Pseudomonas sp. Ag1]